MSYSCRFRRRPESFKTRDKKVEKRVFTALLHSLPPSVHVYTDGSSYGNPGPAGSGFVVRSPAGDYVVYRSHTVGEASNNLAEVNGIHEASDYILTNPSDIPTSVPIYIFVGNRLAINIAVGRAHAPWCRSLAHHTRTKLRTIAQTREVYHVLGPWTCGYRGQRALRQIC